MKKSFASDIERLKNMKDEDIDLTDCPEWTEEQVKDAVVRVGLSPIEKKHRVNIMLSNRLVEWFKLKAGGRGYQTLINRALEESIERETMEEMFRRIIREELKGRKPKAA